MTQSTHYNLNLAEGTDLVNPLTVDVPNYQTIDGAMFANEQAGVGTATELKSGTIHAITRANTNRNVFRFKSTSVFITGDTFTVDGATVTALYPDGSSLKDRCFIIGSDVLCLLDGAQLTVLATYYPEAQNVKFDDTNVAYTANNVQTAIETISKANGVEYTNGVSVKDMLDVSTSTIPASSINSNLTVTKNALRREGRICELILEATASSEISGWTSLLTGVPDAYKPFDSNNAFTITIGNSAVMCNFNENGILNCPNTISQNTSIRFKAIYFAKN